MRACAENVTRFRSLELVGKSPVVVLNDFCKFPTAPSQTAAGAIFEHAGRLFLAGSRLVIEAAFTIVSSNAGQKSIPHSL